jgi:hypothetical protein
MCEVLGLITSTEKEKQQQKNPLTNVIKNKYSLYDFP